MAASKKFWKQYETALLLYFSKEMIACFFNIIVFYSLVLTKLSSNLRLILWQYGLWSFQTGGTKLERFLLKNQHTQRKLSNLGNWVSGEVSKSAKSPNLLTFKVNFLCQKLSESFSIFFH